MATQESWQARNEIKDLFQQLPNAIENYKRFFERLQEIKIAILNDTTKKADLKLIIDQETNLTMTQITTRYTAFKAIYDWLKENAEET